ncbi:helix-turn-helix transcriptional regulator [Pseudonocardia sp. KRD291]|uniref:ArsR/SmtB family transcription factor n=1 Tax=Pseudonocardia sp. KRD291 TaxID=2792007 RepID=UPI001C4A6801|nr:metalloregulator ArsR/SmtB family transcription factor [Pseudonocardia sp. KRD291]MBW0101377.1 winged helix-turn-helix transcriptional regulator [Pseudonocardia sp. KRD291]
MSAGRDRSGTSFGADLAFDALADPVRREILSVLAEHDELSAGALAEQIHTVGRTAVSTHLRVLRIAGLVTERRAGRFRFYAIDPSGAAADVIRLLHGLFRESLDEARSAVETRGEGHVAKTG